MKTLYSFVVELEKQINDTITTKSGLELYIDTRFEGSEFEHRVTEGPVVSTPAKYDTGVEVGDTLYFHHLVVLNEGQALTGDDKHYIVMYDEDHTINNQAIAYKSRKSGPANLPLNITLIPFAFNLIADCMALFIARLYAILLTNC